MTTIEVFTPGQCAQEHEHSLYVLAAAGMRVDSDEGRGLLSEAGALVDGSTRIVRFPPELVEESLTRAPRAFSLGGRRPGFSLAMNAGESTLLIVQAAEPGVPVINAPGLATMGSVPGTDHFVPGVRAGYEKGLGTLFSALAWPDILVGPGTLAESTVFSFDQVIVDVEIWRLCRKMHEGVADADFLAVLEAVRRLRVALVAQGRPTRPTRASTFTGGPMDTKASRPTATYSDFDPAWPQRALDGISPTPFWLDSPQAPAVQPPLIGSVACDLAAVGGGYAGLWTALLAKERDPSLDVVIVEAGRIGWQASGRNGGFCMASLTHGLSNNLARWPNDLESLTQAGITNLNEMRADVARHSIDCDWQDCGEVNVATEPWQVEGIKEEVELAARAGANHEYLDRDAVRAEVDSPSFLAGGWDHDGAIIDPARLAWGLARVCREKGVRIYEGTPATALRHAGAGVVLDTPSGEVRARQAVLATNAFPTLIKRLRFYTVPVYDYVLMSEPLNDEQLASIGWKNRQGLADAGVFFHYFRISEDQRILWGGWDGIYHWRNRIRPEYDQRRATFELLSRQFFETFPQLQGLRFTHGWGGVIDVCSRFTAFCGTAMGGRVAYALGFTGQGVAPVRFGAIVCLDLLAGEQTERTALPIVGSKPIPWPPEPFRYGAIAMTQRSMQRAQDNGGKSDLWLRTLEKLKLGFDT